MATNHQQQPPKEVLEAFSIKDNPCLLKGGQGNSYLCGNVVLKPEEDITEANWTAQTLSELKIDKIRLPEPIQTINGQWVVQEWSAHKFVEGKETKSKWKEKIQIAREFHKNTKNIAKPNFISNRTHPWEIADKMIWGETELKFGEKLQSVLSRLQPHLKPIQTKNQIIHGDLTGNILFHPNLNPAVIDFSPYWRPAEYATAIIIVDSIMWEGAPNELINEMEDSAESNQLLLRATMWRIKTTEEFIKQYNTGNIEEVNQYHRFIDLLLNRKNW